MQVNNLKRVGPKGTEDYWVNTLQFCTVCKEILSRESSQAALRHIDLIPHKCINCTQGNIMKIFGPG